ncbi:Protein GLUTAMINE DUMPER [Quillaja saponaria]|uniref:Protein GLUTAMINE DUMPER n=1 Tax=Quillaja saponaria TaxID=32244 RepID=A0AAD7Q3P1_QUISA|nr:Protein GLUTAMINE DUMPER [Quillaja saponaria]
MRSVNNTTTTNNTIATAGGAHELRGWKSPMTPYMFGGLALMLGFIAMVLIILSCSYRKYNNNSGSASNAGGGGQENSKASMTVEDTEEVVDYDPKIVVIMAGETNPTYLAVPAASSTTCHS